MTGGPSPASDPGLLARLHWVAPIVAGRCAIALVDLETAGPARFALVRASPDTPFEIGSISKALSGMLLADGLPDGCWSLDTRVGRILPAIGGSELGSVSLLAGHAHLRPSENAAGWKAAVDAMPYALFGRNPYRGSPATVVGLAARQPLRARGHRRYSNPRGLCSGSSWPRPGRPTTRRSCRRSSCSP